MRVQRLKDHLRLPWPNGKGTSFEIACQTPGMSGWNWRIAIAPVLEDCVFSHFENVHRQLVVIAGGKMILQVGTETVVCEPGEVVEFPGDIPTTANLPQGPIVDLNLMTVRGQANGTMKICSEPGLLDPALAIVCISQLAKIRVGCQEVLLNHQDGLCESGKSELIDGVVAHIVVTS